MENPRNWINIDETAQNFLTRVSTERPSLNIPPLHRVPLRVGNVVEIVGTSPSCKSEILLQAAVNCILPKEWRGVRFGGLERLVFYLDLDCRFDVVRLSSVLMSRIKGAYDDACSNQEGMRSSRYFIGAFHWIDRACHPLTHSDNRRKTLSLQSCTETIVQEIRNLLELQPFLVLATKANIFSAGTSTYDAARTAGKRSSENLEHSGAARKEGEKLLYRDYMPSVWQSLVTHKIHLGVSDDTEGSYTAKWIQPALNIVDKFAVNDSGIFMIS